MFALKGCEAWLRGFKEMMQNPERCSQNFFSLPWASSFFFRKGESTGPSFEDLRYEEFDRTNLVPTHITYPPWEYQGQAKRGRICRRVDG
jgi:hypothetical protein